MYPHRARITATTQQNLAQFKPYRDPPHNWRIVPCPDCKALEGEDCHTQQGEKMKSFHASRKRMAFRELYGR